MLWNTYSKLYADSPLEHSKGCFDQRLAPMSTGAQLPTAKHSHRLQEQTNTATSQSLQPCFPEVPLPMQTCTTELPDLCVMPNATRSCLALCHVLLLPCKTTMQSIAGAQCKVRCKPSKDAMVILDSEHPSKSAKSHPVTAQQEPVCCSSSAAWKAPRLAAAGHIPVLRWRKAQALRWAILPCHVTHSLRQKVAAAHNLSLLFPMM
jgi:hypothetical protein